MLKKSLVVYVGAVVLAVVGLSSCNTNPPNPPSSANGYVLEVIAGNTNLDDSLFAAGTEAVRARRLLHLQQQLQSRLGVQLVDTQSSAGVGRNFYIAINRDGLPPSKAIGLKLSGPSGAYTSPTTYAAQTAWSVFFPLAQKGEGAYTIEATVDDTRLSKQVQSVQGVGLEIPQVFGRGITATDLAAKWSAVAGAQSYLVLFSDQNTGQFVEGSITKATRLWLTGLKLDAEKVYDVTILALSWDATQSTQKAYPAPLPARFDASAINLGVKVDVAKLEPIPSEIVLSGKPGETIASSIKIKNGLPGLLTYQSSVEGSTHIKLTNEKGAVLYQDEEVLQVEGTCPGSELQELAHLKLMTSDPQQANKVIPVKFECLTPLKAQLVLRKVSPAGNVLNADWSPDGSKIAMASTGGITLWDANTAEFVGMYTGHTHVAWSPNSSELAGLVAQGIKIWNAQTGVETRTISITNPNRVAWSPDSNRIAVVTQNNKVSVFSSPAGELLFQLNTPFSDSITDLEWSPDSSKIATSSSDAIIWDGLSGSEIRRFTNQYARLAWSPDSTRIITGSYINNASLHGVMSIWNVATGNLIDTIDAFVSDVANIAWSSDGSQIAATGNDGADGSKLKVWKTDKTLVSNLPAGSPLDWSPDGKGIVTTASLSLGRIWEVPANTPKSVLGYHGGAINALEFADNKLLSADDSNRSLLNLMDLSTLKTLKTIEVGSPIASAKLANNASKVTALLNQFSNWEIRSWETLSGNPVGNYSLPQFPSIAWSPNGQQVAVVTQNNPIRILDSITGTESLVLQDSTSNFDSYVSWGPDGSTVAASISNRGIVMWDALTGKKIIEYQNGAGPLLVWSLDGKKIAGSGKVFDASSGQILLSTNELMGPLAWNPDSKRIVSIQGNGLAIYSAFSGKKLLSLVDSNPSGYSAIAWSADGNYIAVGKIGEMLLYQITPAP